ncbi:MAG: hypothetical protein RLZZ107_481 [Bacteroidota bacterium]
MEKQSTVLASILLMLSIVLGAFGAHALKDILTQDLKHTFDVGVRYQGSLSMGILILALNADRFSFQMKGLLRAKLIGILLFSGAIYGIVALKQAGMAVGILGPNTPLRGAVSIISWCVFIFRLLKY